MDIKKYLVVLFFFAIGVVIGRYTVNFSPESNTAATTTGSRTSTTITQTPVVTSTPTSDQVDYNPPTNVYTPPSSGYTPTNTNTTTQSEYSSGQLDIFSGITPLTENLSRNNLSNNREQVKNLQKFLIVYKLLNGVADGFFGSLTQKAVINFQSLYGISPAVGFVGPTTRQYINDIISGDPLSRAKPKCSCEPLNAPGSPPAGYWAGSACQYHDACLMGSGLGSEVSNSL